VSILIPHPPFPQWDATLPPLVAADTPEAAGDEADGDDEDRGEALRHADTPEVAGHEAEGWRVWDACQRWRAVELLYRVVRPATVAEFGNSRPYLAPLLLQAYAQLWLCFGEWPEVELRLQGDPEILSRRYLAARVVTRGPVSDAMRMMDSFKRNWWVSKIKIHGRDVVFGLRFVDV
jgi:hypothetical protein